MSVALILDSVNPHYDERLFIEFPTKYKFRTCCVQILFWMSKQKQKNNLCTQLVLKLYFSGNSTNNLLSYWGLTDARMRASEKDLPVLVFLVHFGPQVQEGTFRKIGTKKASKKASEKVTYISIPINFAIIRKIMYLLKIFFLGLWFIESSFEERFGKKSEGSFCVGNT